MRIIELKKGCLFKGKAEERQVSLPFMLPSNESGDISLTLTESYRKVLLEIDGAEGGADIIVDGQCAASHGEEKHITDITSLLTEGDITIRLNEGGGLVHSVKAFVTNDSAYIAPYGVYVRAKMVGNKPKIEVVAQIVNDGDKSEYGIDCMLFNSRNKRMGRRKKSFVFTNGVREVTIPVNLKKGEVYSSTNPELYTMQVSLVNSEGAELDVTRVAFGIKRAYKSYVLEKLVGTTASHKDGVTGKLSFIEGERRKLAAYRQLGYNTLRFVGCPSEALLKAADEMGMYLIVDIFDSWLNAKNKRNGSNTFAYEYKALAELCTKTLRNHPSVVMYSLGNCPTEMANPLGRDIEEELLKIVRKLDPDRPITVAYSSDDVKWTDITEQFADKLDVTGDGAANPHTQNEKYYISLGTNVKNFQKRLSELEDNEFMAGDISIGVLGECGNAELDMTAMPTPLGIYRSIMVGKDTSCITTTTDAEKPPYECESIWTYPKKTCEPVNIYVLTSGDVVALYINDQLIGRKMAGSLNNHIAKFAYTYRSGKLEAVSYARGREVSRTSVSTFGDSKYIKLISAKRRASLDDNGITYLEILITDTDGRPTNSAVKLSAEVDGDGELVGMGNAKGERGYNEITTVNGRALLAVRALQEGKLTVKVNGEELREGRLTLQVK